MNKNIAQAQAALAKEEGKLKKLLKAVKKAMSKEFLWILIILIAGLPVAVIISGIVTKYDPSFTMLKADLGNVVAGYPDFMLAYLIGIAGIYFSRTTAGAVSTLLKKKK